MESCILAWQNRITLEVKIEFFEEARNIVSRDLVQEIINLNKLNIQFNELENQLKTKRTTYNTHKILISDLKYKLIVKCLKIQRIKL